MRCEKGTLDDLRILEEWRAAHGHVLNTFQSLLRNRTKDTDIVVAQRHKRKLTIIDKLKRYPRMRLARMDDVAGCRLIFKNLDELYKFRENMLKARFRHKLKNDVDKYDYIKSPKPTGYRGVHDVYSYNVNSSYGEQYKGLLIEIQYRTFNQHAWLFLNSLKIKGVLLQGVTRAKKRCGTTNRFFRQQAISLLTSLRLFASQ